MGLGAVVARVSVVSLDRYGGRLCLRCASSIGDGASGISRIRGVGTVSGADRLVFGGLFGYWRDDFSGGFSFWYFHPPVIQPFLHLRCYEARNAIYDFVLILWRDEAIDPRHRDSAVRAAIFSSGTPSRSSRKPTRLRQQFGKQGDYLYVRLVCPARVSRFHIGFVTGCLWLKRLGDMAEQSGCAVVLIGHMNKAGGIKAAYRGLGSIDFQAAARSVLIVGRLRDQPEKRIVAHSKSSLAPEEQSLPFELNPESGFRWLGHYDISANDFLKPAKASHPKRLYTWVSTVVFAWKRHGTCGKRAMCCTSSGRSGTKFTWVRMCVATSPALTMLWQIFRRSCVANNAPWAMPGSN